jgi:AcrR family transcriptional regulator
MATTRDAERAGAARRAGIVSAALALFGASGYRGTSLAAVADAAGITRSGLLHHFPSKEALLAAVLAERDRQAVEAAEVGREYQGPALQRALDIAEAIVARNEQNRELTWLGHLGIFEADAPEFARNWAAERLTELRDNLTGVVENGIAAGEVRAGTNAAAVASVVIAAISGLEEQWLLDESFDMVAAMRTLTAILARDLIVQPDR